MNRVQRSVSAWMVAVSRHPVPIILAVLCGTLALGGYAAGNLGLNSDTGSMFSEELPWRQADLEYKSEFPQLRNEVLVVIDGLTPERAEMAQRRLADHLRGHPDLFFHVYAPLGDEFFRRQGLLYMETRQLAQLRNNLSEYGDDLKALEADPTAAGLLDQLIDTPRDGQPDSREVDVREPESVRDSVLLRIVAEVGAAFQSQMHRQSYDLPWREILTGSDASSAERRRFILFNPRIDHQSALPAGAAMNELRRAIRDITRLGRSGIRIRVTGSEAVEHESIASAYSGTRRTAAVALLAVGAILFAGLGSLRLVAASLITLVAGLAATAAFAAATVGQLNLISIAFAVLYIGLGIDYAAHLCLGLVEALRERAGYDRAVALTGHRVGTALLISALTTAACFYAFVPTDFRGISELGLIGGTGMLISVLMTLTLLPALLSVRPFRITEHRPARLWESDEPGRVAMVMHELTGRRGRAVALLAATVLVAALLFLPRLWFDHDPMRLADPESESLRTLKELAGEPSNVPDAISVLASSPADARELVDRLLALPEVGEVRTLESSLPTDQTEKLQIIGEIAATLGSEIESDGLPPPSISPVGRTVESVAGFRERVLKVAQTMEGAAADSARGLALLLTRWQRWLDEWRPETQGRLVETLDQGLAGSLAYDIRRIRVGTGAEPMTAADLPTEIRSRWIGTGGQYRVQIVPAQRLASSADVAVFVDRVSTVAPGLTGIPVYGLQSARSAIRAFWRALLLAVLATAGMLVILMRSARDSALVVAPVLLAGVVTLGAAAALHMPMTYSNLITLPLLLGIGVDNGIHIVHRIRSGLPRGGNFFATSTSRAIVVAGLTTMGSLGSMSVSSHRALASMGQLLAIGMVAVLLSTMILLPGMLVRTGSGAGPVE
ncbi:MAG: MMPL family transporter [marine benthic group bacterium]|nr:MMPL family transporter [Gemmatimonadota bacterium]